MLKINDGKNLKTIRIVELEKSIEEMAKIIGTHSSTYSRKEKDIGQFTMEEAVKIYNYLKSCSIDISFQELFF